MANRSGTRRVFSAGIIVGIVASVGAIQVAPIVAGAVVSPPAVRAVVVPSPEPIETMAPESPTDEYRRMYGRGAGEDGALSMTSTAEYRQMYEHR